MFRGCFIGGSPYFLSQASIVKETFSSSANNSTCVSNLYHSRVRFRIFCVDSFARGLFKDRVLLSRFHGICIIQERNGAGKLQLVGYRPMRHGKARHGDVGVFIFLRVWYGEGTVALAPQTPFRIDLLRTTPRSINRGEYSKDSLDRCQFNDDLIIWRQWCRDLSRLITNNRDNTLRYLHDVRFRQPNMGNKDYFQFKAVNYVAGFRVKTSAFRFCLWYAISEDQNILGVMRQANVSSTFRLRIFVVTVRHFRGRIPIFLFQAAPSRFNGHHRAKRGGVIRVLKAVARLDPRKNLCPRRRQDMLEFPILLRQFMLVGVFRHVIARVDGQFRPLQSLVASRVRRPNKNRRGPIPPINDFRDHVTRPLPTGSSDAFKGRTINRLIPSRRLFTFTTCVFTCPLRRMALGILFVNGILFLRTLLTRKALFPMNFLNFVTPRIGVA